MSLLAKITRRGSVSQVPSAIIGDDAECQAKTITMPN